MLLNNALIHFQLFFLILLRVIAFIAVSPIMSIQTWPSWAKIGLAAFVSLSIVPSVHSPVPSAFNDPGNYIIYALLESLTGMMIGYVASVIVSAISIAGELFDIQIGYNSATLFNPQSGVSSGLNSTFESILFTFYFLGLNGLDGLMLAILNSYKEIGLGKLTMPHDFVLFLVHTLSLAMSLGFQMAAPLLAALLMTDITFSFMSRAVPQMNVYIVGLPAKLFVGLSMFAVSLPGLTYLFGQVFTVMFQQVNAILQLLGG